MGWFNAGGLKVNVDGTVGAPSITFGSDTDTGLYRHGANQLGLAVGGAASIIYTTAQGLGLAGGAGSPFYGFASDVNTGMYLVGADELGFSAGGTKSLSLTASEVYMEKGQVVNRTASGAGNYTILVSDYIIAVTGITAAGDTYTLPAAATAGAGKVFVIKDEGGNADATDKITIDGDGAETIDGAASHDIVNAYGSVTLYCNGSAWFII